MNIKTFQGILPFPRQMSIFDAKSDAVLEHLTFCDGAKGFVDKKDEAKEEDNDIVNKGVTFFSLLSSLIIEMS